MIITNTQINSCGVLKEGDLYKVPHHTKARSVAENSNGLPSIEDIEGGDAVMVTDLAPTNGAPGEVGALHNEQSILIKPSDNWIKMT